MRRMALVASLCGDSGSWLQTAEPCGGCLAPRPFLDTTGAAPAPPSLAEAAMSCEASAPRSESWASPGHADLIPEAAVEVEVVALRLARAVVADVGV